MKILFWLSISIISYTYFVYPVLIYILSLFYKKPISGKYLYPTVSIIISAYNEEGCIESKIKSLLELDYPDQRLEILIGSDGSDDATAGIVSRYAGEKIKFFPFKKRQGKPSVLNRLAPQASSEILVFTDARQRLDKTAIKELVKNFSDKRIGSVSSELFYESRGQEDKTGIGLGLYWKYEKFIRKSESRMGSMLGATGALYAIRKELYPVLPAALILDDVYIPMRIVEQGYRAIFEPKALVFDRVFKDPKAEFSRKARTLAGNYQLSVYFRELFNPLKGKISWQFFSHKFLRLVVPFLLVVLFASNALIISGGLHYKMFFASQAMFYILALLGGVFKYKNRVLDIPYMFCIMNLAAVFGFYKYLMRKQSVLWQKAQMGNEGA